MLRSSRGYPSDMLSDNKRPKLKRSAAGIAVFRAGKAKFGAGTSLSNSTETRFQTSASLTTTKISGTNVKERKSVTSIPAAFVTIWVQNSVLTPSIATRIYSQSRKPRRIQLQPPVPIIVTVTAEIAMKKQTVVQSR